MIVILELCVLRADLAQGGGRFEIVMVTTEHGVVTMEAIVVGNVLRSVSIYKCQRQRAGLHMKLK